MIKQYDIDLSKLTGAELAEIFWDMDSDKQAYFFNKLASLSDHMLGFQLTWVVQSKYLGLDGRRVMQEIGEYANDIPAS